MKPDVVVLASLDGVHADVPRGCEVDRKRHVRLPATVPHLKLSLTGLAGGVGRAVRCVRAHADAGGQSS